MTTFFEKGEVVWGKIKGYPWWPAIITDLNNNLIYTIKFMSDNTYAKLSSKFLLKYNENKTKILESNKKNKKLLGAIKAADLEIKNQNNINNNNISNSISDINDIEKNNILKKNIDTEKNINYNNFEQKNIEKLNNNDIKNNNLINKSEIMSSQNNRVNIFSIIKNNKNNNITNNLNSSNVESKALEDNQTISEKKNNNYETYSNNNDIIINKNVLSLENDDEISLLLNNKQQTETKKKEKEKEKGKKLKKIKKNQKIDTQTATNTDMDMDVPEKEEEKKEEKNFIKIEIESLEVKSLKKKDMKKKIKIDDKVKEEKKRREEEDNLIYQIDEYFYKIFELFNSKNYDKLNYEKNQFKKVLIFLSKYKRANFIEFLKMTNISKYIQYFLCYLKNYDIELNKLAKKVYRNFHVQFNREYFSDQYKEI